MTFNKFINELAVIKLRLQERSTTENLDLEHLVSEVFNW